MATPNGIRQRNTSSKSKPTYDPLDIGAGATPKAPSQDSFEHPAGPIKHGPLTQILRAFVSLSWFLSTCIIIHINQFVGAPLYLYSKPLYYAWQSLAKQSFAIILIQLTNWFAPTVIRVSWDASCRGQLTKAKDNSGRLETRFPQRMILMSNHQIYTDWIYLWWLSYTSRCHGAIFIILKDSLRWIPLLGWGMMFYGFIFMSRKWETDKPRLAHRLAQLKKRYMGPGQPGAQIGAEGLKSAGMDPMWLLIFPEGTNLSANTRKKSVAWSEKSGLKDMKHLLLPRSTGMFFCLNELADTIDYVYDCTVAYEGVPHGGYAQDYFSLRSTFLQGRPPKSVNFHWRRFEVSDIPLQDQDAFQLWVTQRWREKDELIETYVQTGRFPADVEDGKSTEDGYIETGVQLRSWSELVQPYVIVLTLLLLGNIVRRFWQQFVTRKPPSPPYQCDDL